MVIKTAQYRQKYRHRDQWNKIKNPEGDLYKYAELIEMQKKFKRGRIVFPTNVAEAIRQPEAKQNKPKNKNKNNLNSSPYKKKINSEWIFFLCKSCTHQ